jgi:phenylalanyl-tRNA synthetase beta chain
MEVSLNWLNKYADISGGEGGDPASLATALTSLGFEVEGMRTLGGIEGVVAAEVLECAKHPEADKLSLCKVSDGSETFPVVCGAPNVAAGQKVLLAKVGAELPGRGGEPGFKIKKARIRGAESLGMICAEDEVGLGEGHEGILVLDPAVKPGTPMKAIPGLSDTVFELNVTPNRPDALCHVGVARELAAKLGKPLCYPGEPLREEGPDVSTLASLRLDAIAGCTLYVGRVIQGVKVGPSPAWLVKALQSLGKRSINNVVDLTNYVLLELGQPSHAFDLDRIHGRQVIVRSAAAMEKLTTLDGVERTLTADDLVIADAEGPMVLAGVMGGKDSEVSEATRNIFLEAAYFNPATVRRQSRRHGLSSDSSFRFERGVDPLHTAQVADYLAALIARWCGGTVAKGRLVASSPEHPSSPRELYVRPARAGRLIGAPITAEETVRRLESIGLRWQRDDGGAGRAQVHGEEALRFAIPGFRGDLEREADLIEEIARLGDYNNIPVALPTLPLAATPLPPLESLSRQLRQALRDAGLNETLSLRFSSRKALAKLGLPADHPREAIVPLRNPLSEEWEILPSTSLPSLLSAVAYNQNNQERDIRFFEIAKAFYHRPDERTDRKPGVREEDMLYVALAGEWPDRRPWGAETGVSAPLEFHHLKGLLENLLAGIGVKTSLTYPGSEAFLHPHESGDVNAVIDQANPPAVLLGADSPAAKGSRTEGPARIGSFGVLHPRAQAAFDLKGPVLVAEISLQGLLSAARKERKFQPFGHFSAVSRDLNILVDESLRHGDLVERIPAGRIANLQDIRLNSVYRGQGVPEGKKALHYTFTYRHAEKTLTDEEVNKAQDKLRAELAKDPAILFK